MNLNKFIQKINEQQAVQQQPVQTSVTVPKQYILDTGAMQTDQSIAQQYYDNIIKKILSQQGYTNMPDQVPANYVIDTDPTETDDEIAQKYWDQIIKPLAATNTQPAQVGQQNNSQAQ